MPEESRVLALLCSHVRSLSAQRHIPEVPLSFPACAASDGRAGRHLAPAVPLLTDTHLKHPLSWSLGDPWHSFSSTSWISRLFPTSHICPPTRIFTFFFPDPFCLPRPLLLGCPLFKHILFFLDPQAPHFAQSKLSKHSSPLLTGGSASFLIIN